MNPPRINKWLDLLDRAGWTAVQASIGAAVAYLATGNLGWQEGLVFIGTATLASVAKVVIGQNTGSDASGSLIGTAVIEPPPVAETAVPKTTKVTTTRKP